MFSSFFMYFLGGFEPRTREFCVKKSCQWQVFSKIEVRGCAENLHRFATGKAVESTSTHQKRTKHCQMFSSFFMYFLGGFEPRTREFCVKKSCQWQVFSKIEVRGCAENLHRFATGKAVESTSTHQKRTKHC